MQVWHTGRMAKKTSFTLQSPLSVQQLRDTLISDAFLLSTEEMEEGQQVSIIYSDKFVDAAGAVRCVVIGRPSQDPQSGAAAPGAQGHPEIENEDEENAQPSSAEEGGRPAPANGATDGDGSELPDPSEIDSTGHDHVPSNSGVKQTTVITPVEETRSGQAFSMSTVMPLPAGLATMFTDMRFSQPHAAQGSEVQVNVRVESKLPIVGARIAKQLLGNSEVTVNKGLRRAERLALR